MSQEYIVCSQGHFYKKSEGSCPYCNDQTQAVSPQNLESPTINIGGNKTELNIPGSDRPLTNPLQTFIPGITDQKDKEQRTDKRKIVGWIISYKMDPMGLDFRIYEGRNTIGRSSENHISVFEETVSAKHAIILFRNGRFFLSDEMSANGTYLNGEEVLPDEKKRIKDGDTILFGKGKAEFIFKTAVSLEQ